MTTPDMKVTMLLADAAQAIENKLYILGGGWSITGPDPTPFAIALKIEVPWDQTETRHRWELRLLDEDATPVFFQTPQGEQPIKIGSEFEVGRPPGVAPGTPIDLALAINCGPLPIPPGGRYVWMLLIDDETDETWQVAFSTRPAVAPAD